MNKHLALSAWRGNDPLGDLPDADRLPYLMLRAVYHAYRAGTISREEGDHIKGYLMRYAALSPSEQASLLQYAFTHLTERAGNGDAAALADSKELARTYNALIGKGTS